MQIDADLLNIEYEMTGPDDGAVVLLLHGWPDDASTWADVAPVLNDAGLRTIAPMTRGFGGTRFLSAETPRTGNACRLAMDTIGLMDALGVDRFSIAGHDWGSNTAEAIAVGWPDRIERIAMLASPSRLGGVQTPSFQQARLYWYHWFQATERGADAVRDDPKSFARIMWESWSPTGWFDEAEFDRVARSFDTPDFVDVTLHSYRSRWDEAEPDPSSVWLEEKVKATKQLSIPCLFFQGEEDGVTPPEGSEKMPEKFTGPFERILLPGVGHFPTREAPDRVAPALAAHFG